jgi:cbb3-type cytochrome oxidase maturation protein
MSVILILIIASLSLALAFLAGFIWAVKTGQFEDTYTPSMRILLDEQTGGPERRPPVSLTHDKSQEPFLSAGEPKPTGSRRSGDTILNKSNT